METEVDGNMSIGKTETEVESLRRELKLSKETTRLELQEVRRKAKAVIEKSSKENERELEALRNQLEEAVSVRENLEAELHTRKLEGEETEKRIQDSRKEISELRLKLEEAVSQGDEAKKPASPSVETSVKIAELEKMLGQRQNEVSKTKEKAKQMLKEMNAEKRELEAQFKVELEESGKKLSDAEKSRLATAKELAEANKGLAGAMATINDLQGTLKQLKVDKESSAVAVESAHARAEALEVQYTEYKEHARTALAQKDSTIAKLRDSSRVVDEDVQFQIAEGHARAEKLAAKLAEMNIVEHNLEVAEERSRAMEARIADLTAQLATSSLKASQKEVEVEDAKHLLMGEIELERGRAEAADQRNAQTLVRMRILEKCLEDAEATNKQLTELHNEEVAKSKRELEELESKRRKDKQSADAARRTVEAAMKAYSPVPDSLDLDDTKPLLDDEVDEMREQLNDSISMNKMYAEQLALLKTEIRAMEASEERTSRLSDNLQYDYLKNVIIKFIETDDFNALMPVLANVLAMTPEEIEEVKTKREEKMMRSPSLLRTESWKLPKMF
uniref:GRIP domain-containing protein n=1 Tax=Rhodosorus marinus TaxID=101924 RepID=A0A7S2ZHJ9_9RHOD|mmetsp:Transcript_18717/g.75230  ORF Transcript_18717/g.75230 Transcript_18717/m.75230 type:complete len:562 (+) Transcript_18717:374-2059(+)|eukprot:CAMPEP_0113964028 /NCGR_PEP_ID=MMETSP0011_2-20120614/6873_1 /TAXON_ID=101924 /ORGANISM="Rhodosorus marinus" /LENGTH=561 /DNA_ID=CAMNT_0000976207 /DNA_START=300 /DNA_END=1985 /DNA_ORIENTATION=- /assembly_acc=CAM_ASM_000156